MPKDCEQTHTKESANFKTFPKNCGNCHWCQHSPFGPAHCREIEGLRFESNEDFNATCDLWVRQ